MGHKFLTAAIVKPDDMDKSVVQAIIIVQVNRLVALIQESGSDA
jgi:hypothetical protein